MARRPEQQCRFGGVINLKNKPKKVFIVHGEAHAADVLRVKIKDEFGFNCEVPELYAIEEIDWKRETLSTANS